MRILVAQHLCQHDVISLFFKNRYFIFIFIIFWFLFNYSCLHFLPTPPPLPSQTHLPACLHRPPWFCICVLYSSSWKLLSSLSLPPFPLAIVRLFLTSMSLVTFCLLFSFVDYVPVKGEIIWYLSLTTWLISLESIIWSEINQGVREKYHIVSPLAGT